MAKTPKLTARSFKDLQELFNKMLEQKRASEAFELVGSPYTKEGVLVGEAGPISRPPVPYKSVPAVIEPKSPDIIDVPFNVIDDVTKTMPIEPALSSQAGGRIDPKTALAIGTGGLGGLALASSSLKSKDKQPSIESIVPKNINTDNSLREAFPHLNFLDKIPEGMTKPGEKPQDLTTGKNKLINSLMQRQKEPVVDSNIIDFGNNTLANLETLKELQKKSSDAEFVNQIGRIGSAMASQMSGTKNVFDDILAGQVKTAKELPEEYQKQVQFEKEDPNSAMSKGYRDIAKHLGFNIKGLASASDLERLMPQLANIYNQKQAQAARKEEKQMMMELTKATKAEALDKKQESESNKFIERASDKLVKRTDAYSKIKKASALIDEAVRNPSAIGDVTALYSVISALDPNSVVREGEIGLAKSAGGLIGRAQVGLSQLSSNPKLINAKTLSDIRKTIKQLESLNDQEYNMMRSHYVKQARARGVPEDRMSEIDPFYEGMKLEVPEKIEPLKKETKKVAPIQQKVISPSDVDSMSDEEVEAALKARGL